MSKATVQTVQTEFVTRKDGTVFAYRRLGLSTGVPLLFLMHFRGTIDHWDPLLVHALADQRPVILFDNAGVGHSTGLVDNTLQKMAEHVVEFLDLIGAKQVDILGFSLGGIVAPFVALDGPKGLVRKLVLTGTTSTAGDGNEKPMTDERVLPNASGAEVTVENILVLFFRESKTSEAAGRAFWDRIHERTKETSGEDRANYVSTRFADGGAGITAMMEAVSRGNDIAYAEEGSYNRLGEIRVPTLVANGNEDIMIPTINSFVLSQKIPNTFLIIYPDSGHGFLFQYAELFAQQVNSFLDGW